MRRDGPPDKRLFRRARHGDRQAFVVLLRRYDPRMRRLVLRLVADPARVDVVLNRAYLRAWRSLPHVEPPESVAEWIYRVVYNACVNEVRWAPARPMAGPPEGPWVPLPLASPSRRLAGLRALSAEDRVALVLVDGEGFTLEAAANILKKPEVDVAADVMRARQLWRRLVVGEPEPRSVRATVVLAPSAAEVEAREAEAAAVVEAVAAANGDPRGHVKVVDPEAAAEATKPRPRPKPATRTSPPAPPDDGQAAHPGVAVPEPTPETDSVPAERPAPADAPAAGGLEGQAPPTEATSPRSARRWPFARKSKQPKPTPPTNASPDVAPTPPPASPPEPSTPAAPSEAPAVSDGAADPASETVVADVAATADGLADGVEASEAAAAPEDDTAAAGSDAPVAADPVSEGVASSDALEPEAVVPDAAATADGPADGVVAPEAATPEDDAEASTGGADGQADVAPAADAGGSPEVAAVAGTSADDSAGGAKGARAGRPPVRRGTGGRRARVKPVAEDGAEAVLAAMPVASDDPTGEEPAEEPAPTGPVFVVSIPVAPEATDVSEAAAEVDPGSSGAAPSDDDTGPERRRTTSSGAAGARRKRRRGDVKRDPRTRGRGAAGGEGSKTDHAGDGQGRSDGPRETS